MKVFCHKIDNSVLSLYQNAPLVPLPRSLLAQFKQYLNRVSLYETIIIYGTQTTEIYNMYQLKLS